MIDKWDEDVILEMFGMFTDGLTAEQVAKKLEEKFKMQYTRSSVIGKMYRETLGITQYLKDHLEFFPNEPESETIRRTLSYRRGRT